MFTTTMDRKGKLYAFDMSAKKYFWANPKDVAFIEDYYKLDDRAQGQYVVEKEMSKLESQFAAIHRGIVQEGALPTDPKAMGILLYFMALLSTRNPLVRSSFEKSMKEVLKIVTYQMAAHDRLPKPSDYIDQSTLERMGLTKDSDARDLLEKNLIDIGIKNFYQVQTMLQMADAVYGLLQKRRWYLHVAPRSDSDCFITSDNPLILLPNDVSHSVLPPGFAMTDTKVLFPLSRRLLLLGHFDRISRTSFEANPKEIYFYNLMQTMYAFRQVYSQSMSAQIYTKDKGIRGFAEYFA